MSGAKPKNKQVGAAAYTNTFSTYDFPGLAPRTSSNPLCRPNQIKPKLSVMSVDIVPLICGHVFPVDVSSYDVLKWLKFHSLFTLVKTY